MLPFLVAGPILAASVIETTLSNSTEVTLSTLFTAADWAGPKLKRVRIPAGVTVGSTHQATPALNCGTGRGGLLEIILDGNLDGAGGITNGQNGGDALVIPQAGVILKGAGNSRPGGGAGGDGGNGGGGVYYTGRLVQEGPNYASYGGGNSITTNYIWVYDGGVSRADGYWGGAFIGSTGGPGGSVGSGGWTYFVGSGRDTTTDGRGLYEIYRQQTVYDVANFTSGGAKGTHGRGQGFDGASASGTSGSAGGTNAGAGGAGGAGGAFGASGTDGTAGSAGNNGSGAGGSSKGLSGYGVNGNSNLNRTAFTGSILGRTV